MGCQAHASPFAGDLSIWYPSGRKFDDGGESLHLAGLRFAGFALRRLASHCCGSRSALAQRQSIAFLIKTHAGCVGCLTGPAGARCIPLTGLLQRSRLAMANPPASRVRSTSHAAEV